MSVAQVCRIKNCQFSNKRIATGLCMTHYARYRRGNDPVMPTYFDKRHAIIDGEIARIPVGVNAKDGYTLVDKEYSYLDKYKWHICNGYAVTTKSGHKNVHIYHMIVGKPEKGNEVDHINRDRLDNRSCNLRIVTKKQNVQNSSPRSSSGYKGVYKYGNKWKAGIKPDKNTKRIHIGCFDTKEEAAKAYDNVAKEAWGEFAYLNFPKA